jgi:hypothetical protein
MGVELPYKHAKIKKKMLFKGISMKIEILKDSHLISRTVLHFSEYGFSHENIYDQIITIIQ